MLGQQKAANLEAAINAMHKHPTAVAFTYILPGEHKMAGFVFLKGKKPVLLFFPVCLSRTLSLCPSLSPIHSRTHSLTYSLTHSYPFTYSLSISLSLSLSLSFSFSLSLSLSFFFFLSVALSFALFSLTSSRYSHSQSRARVLPSLVVSCFVSQLTSVFAIHVSYTLATFPDLSVSWLACREVASNYVFMVRYG